MPDPRSAIPSVDRLLASAEFAAVLATAPRVLVIAALQDVQHTLREQMADGGPMPQELDAAWFAREVDSVLARRRRRSLRPVINATGVVLHTNLGRAPLADAALAAIATVGDGYSNLEYDVERGERGSRYDHCSGLLCELTGAEAALVVNNNAAALVLALAALAAGRSVLVSRGELVEIGGGFRVPEIVTASGVRLREVGATNRTRTADYARALDGDVAAVVKVHRSNFRMSGFVEEASLADLAAATGSVPLVHDLGSGLLLEPALLRLPPEPTPASALRQGADVVAISGDKLLGGPQAGILLGRRALIDAMRRHPLCRAMRVDKLTLAALEATLALYRDPADAISAIPTLRMIACAPAALRQRADELARALARRGIRSDVVSADGAVGGGTFPGVALPGWAVALNARYGPRDTDARLRACEPAIVARTVADRVLLDPRTILPDEADQVPALIADALA